MQADRVTLKVVAEAAGVHPSTVSRALRRTTGKGADDPNSVRIREIAKSLGYVPNANAASLKTHRSTAFGVIVPRLTDVVLSGTYDAIEHTANAAGFDTFVANSHDDPAEQLRRIELLLGRNVDGLIIGDARLDNDNVAGLDRRGVKFVLVNRRKPGQLSVTCDDYRGGWLIGEHLADLGHQRVGIITGPRWASTATDRLSGCVDALESRGVVVHPDMRLHQGFDAADGAAGARTLLTAEQRPTAIFAANDASAIGVMGVLRDFGMRVRDDVAVVGYNDIDLCASLPVPLTTVRSPFREMGTIASQTLLSLVEGRSVSSAMLQPQLVVRESTSSAPAQ
ncbi:LacI family DNA-binding transcriptional regulator [Mycolicibacterium vaccae]|uniref:LacI family transcriptional regulator n=1 Tax=Mycolicibacterium vaccae ATCC 25954 TaxID=1194972 RepID=K0V0N3_MYCVA|nr:LacI family DNA-binding transcriptional regulator [Mycolicibacterium vaccae]ANI40914.1 LacI family transcription regulator [Mycolicibacterium vaccae 95051]EJZ12912.1 LacI family transcriptional regulator [Mycolicibacterium vaccae ATCC 25954]